MVVEEQAGVAPYVTASAIDPFGLAPDWISSIRGLGGDSVGPDAAYAFHTSYEDFGDSEVVYALAFDNLVATQGVLVLRVNAYPNQSKAVAYQIILAELLLRGIMADEGRARIRFIPRPGIRYALLGHIYSDTDASADGLSITAQYTSALDADSERLIAARRTVFTTPAVRPIAKLQANYPARLLDPVSQWCTARQFDEPVYAEWLGRLNLPLVRDRAQWEIVYTLQALRRYGVLETGAQGLAIGLGADSSLLLAEIAAHGCQVLATAFTDAPEAPDGGGDEPAPSWLDAWRRPDICPDATFDQRVTARLLPRGELPADLVGFDFLWCPSAHAWLDPVPANLAVLVGSILALKPGGVAVFTNMVSLDPLQPAVDANGVTVFQRKDFERLALMLIGAGHEVAQLNFATDPEPDAGATVNSFGLIVRRGLRV